MTLRQKAADSDHIPCVMIKKDEPILLESCKNHSAIQTNGICTTLTSNMGYECKYIPMIVQEVKNGRTDRTESCGEPRTRLSLED